ncbi:hypothetical protein L3Q82_003922 [Scortum barcoo]|uniref:Uncharacterized protein n=1 Tax=Scortum barcoo TaxID=214431 RepID=A0ACB8X6D9_9TELE|nr:hypothetical protein L3Q82_003922 [Scortum barcoo]
MAESGIEEGRAKFSARVISPESGHMKSDSSFSEDVFVKLDSSCKMFILRLWDLNTSMEMKQGFAINICFTIDGKGDKEVRAFDCSAKFHGISLNDTLLTGPDLINPLVGVLCRFRKEAVAIICDIERMFYQFSVTPESRNYLKFLWWKGGDLEKEPQEYRMAVHLFGAASSPGCANFGLKHLAQQHEVNYPLASTFVKKNFYVDDGLVSVPSVEEAKKLIAESQELCKRGGLRLHKFSSNEEAALSCLDPSERATNLEPLEFDPTPSERALGIQWSIKDDTFSFNISLKDQPSTRRGCLSVIASLYDPLGFIAPFILKGKRILQELCHKGIGWDDPLPEEMKPWYKNDKDEVHCSLVMAKARVAPSKVTSIPRLELAAAVVSTKVSVMLKGVHVKPERDKLLY